MRILIWGGDSWANQGDAAVLEGTLCALRAAAPQAKLVVASDRPALTQARHGVAAVPRASRRLLGALWRSDLVLWGGGQLIQNDSSKLFLFVQLLFLTLALLLRKPVVCYAQGVGPVHGSLSRFLTRIVVGKLRLITVRDQASAARLAALGIADGRVQVLTDPSFCLPAAPCSEARAVLARVGITQPFAVIAVRRWGHYRGSWLPVRFYSRQAPYERSRQFDDFCGAIAAAGDYLAQTLGLQVLLLPMCPDGDQEDDVVADEVKSRMACPSSAVVLDDVLPPATLKALLGRAGLVLAMRTHAGILATAMGTPVASLSYQGKGVAFMTELGLDCYTLPIEELSESRSVELVERVWRDRAAIRCQLLRQVPDVQARAAKAARLALATVSPTPPKLRRRDVRLGSAYRARLAAAIGVRAEGPRVLDVGAADGRLLSTLGAGQGVALDIAPEPLGGREFVRGDGLHAPFSDRAFDTVIAFDVLEHVVDDASLACELMRLVRPGGTLWVSVPSRDTAIFPPFLTGWAHRRWGHVRPGYSREQLGALFEGCGEVTIIPWNEPVYRVSYLPLKALSLVWPFAALALLGAVTRLDAKLQRGSKGHFFARITLPS